MGEGILCSTVVALTWRQVLERSKIPFEAGTDPQNLEALKTPWKLSPKQVQWAQYFNRFDFELKYILGGGVSWQMPCPTFPKHNCEEVLNSIIPVKQ